MSTTHETGHAVNVANFQKLINLCTSLGGQYAPTKTALQMTPLTTLHTEAVTALEAVTDAGPPVVNAINHRIEVNAILKPLATRLVNALDATDASDLLIADVKTINRKIQGKRKPTKAETPIEPGQDPPTQKQISASQQSFVQLLDNFKELRALILSEPSYNPAEVALQQATIDAHITTIETANNDVNLAAIELANARIHRNEVLYHKQYGLVATAAEVKKYIKSVFGPTSDKYKQFSAIKFTYSR